MNIFPNPFTGFTNIQYSISESAHIKAEIFDMTGRSVKLLFDGMQSSGTHSLRFENNNSGSYILRMQIGEEVIYKKIMEVK